MIYPSKIEFLIHHSNSRKLIKLLNKLWWKEYFQLSLVKKGDKNMGMDVSGLNPTTEAGKYFRNNVWWWRPLAAYIVKVAPEIASKVEYWQSNDGDGLKNQEDCNILADALEKAIANKIPYEDEFSHGQFNYPFSYENVQEFCIFLRGCGGFEIY